MAGKESSDHFENDDEYRSFGSSSMGPRLKSGLDMQKLITQGTYFEMDMEDGFKVSEEAEGLVNDPSFTELYKKEVLDKKNKRFEALFDILDVEDFGNFDKLSATKVNITEDGGVKKLTVTEGVGKVISDQSKVFIDYIAVYEGSEEPFDATIVRGHPQSFTLGDANVLPGIYHAVKTMRMTEVSKFLFSPEYAFGKNGAPPRVPPNRRILFVIELLDSFREEANESILRKSADERALMEFPEIRKEAEKLRNEGNTLYSESRFPLAIRKYRSGIRILEDFPVVGECNEKIRNQILFTLNINLAQTYLKMEKAPQACVASRMALRFNDSSQGLLYKAYFRFAQAKFQLKSYEEARDLCAKALKFQPKSKSIIELQNEILQKLREDEANLKFMCKKMFQASTSTNAASNPVVSETTTNSAIPTIGSDVVSGVKKVD